MPCIDCKHLDLKAVPEMARQGYGVCPKKIGVFISIRRGPGCEQLSQASEAVIQNRRIGLERQK